MQPQRRRPDRAGPPRAQPVHHQRAVCDRTGDTDNGADATQHETFREKHSPHAGGRHTDGAQQSGFASALLDSQAKEQHRQKQRRRHQKGAEVREVLAEIGGASRRTEALVAHRPHHQPELGRVETRAERCRVAIARLGCQLAVARRQAHRRAIAKPRRPEPLADLERNERLRRRAVLVPVILIVAAHPAKIDGKRRIPVGQRPGVRDSGIHGREIPIGREPGNRHDRRDAKFRRLRRQPARFFPHVVVE